MFLHEKGKLNLNGAIFLFSCSLCAVFASIQLSPITTTNNVVVPCNIYGSRVAGLNGADTKLSAEQRFFRKNPPSSYCVRFEGCSQLITNTPTIQKYETRPFNVGGFNWTFIIEPAGSKNSLGTWISTYVAIDPSGLVGANREVYADLKFLAYSKIIRQYWTSQETELRVFQQSKTTLGNPNFIRHVDFKAKDRDYIFDNDQCVFGVDISVYPFNKWEVVSIDNNHYEPRTWKLLNFFTLTRDFYISDEFSIGGKNWAFKVYPNGNGAGKGNSLSLYVILSGNQTLQSSEKVYVRAKLRVLDQKHSKHLEKTSVTWFDRPGEASGFEQFVPLSDLQNPANGYIEDNALTVQVQFEALSSSNYYSSNAAHLKSTY